MAYPERLIYRKALKKENKKPRTDTGQPSSRQQKEDSEILSASISSMYDIQIGHFSVSQDDICYLGGLHFERQKATPISG